MPPFHSPPYDILKFAIELTAVTFAAIALLYIAPRHRALCDCVNCSPHAPTGTRDLPTALSSLDGPHTPLKVLQLTLTDSMLAGLAIMTYYAALLLGTSVSAAILRRHLMVWKVFAPRFMAAVLGVLAVDLGVLLGVGLGVGRVTQQVKQMFQGQIPPAVSEVKEKTH
jgi:hypothetical protein